MSFFKTLYGGVTRDMKIRRLKEDFHKQYPGEKMKGALEGYCGVGMMVAQSVNDGTDHRLDFISAYERDLELEQEHHRPFAEQAYQIGASTVFKR